MQNGQRRIGALLYAKMHNSHCTMQTIVWTTQCAHKLQSALFSLATLRLKVGESAWRVDSQTNTPKLLSMASSAAARTIRPWQLVSCFVQADTISVVHRVVAPGQCKTVCAADFHISSTATAACAAAVKRVVQHAMTQHIDTATAPGKDNTAQVFADELLPLLVMLPDLTLLGFQIPSALSARQAEVYDALVSNKAAVFVNSLESCLGKATYYNTYTPAGSMEELQELATAHQQTIAEGELGGSAPSQGQMAAEYACRRMQEDVQYLWETCCVQEGGQYAHHPRAFVDNYGYEGDDWTARWSWAQHTDGHNEGSPRWPQAVNLALCNAYQGYAALVPPPPGATAGMPDLALPVEVSLPEQPAARMQFTKVRAAVATALQDTAGNRAMADATVASDALLACARLPGSLLLRPSVGRSYVAQLSAGGVPAEDE